MSPKCPPSIFSYFATSWSLKQPEESPFTILSLRYSADFGRSWLVGYCGTSLIVDMYRSILFRIYSYFVCYEVYMTVSFSQEQTRINLVRFELNAAQKNSKCIEPVVRIHSMHKVIFLYLKNVVFAISVSLENLSGWSAKLFFFTCVQLNRFHV